MAQIKYSRNALANLERICEFLATESVDAASQVLDLINEAIALLARHPLIGRPIDKGLRELVISQGRTGYIALYHYDPRSDAVLILAIRHQRESGFRYNPAP